MAARAESLALFGLPLSEPAMETNGAGDTVLTQWFERARFEDHGAKGVLLGLLGNEITVDRRSEAAFQPVSPPLSADDFENTAWAVALFERTNEERAKLGRPALPYNGDLQAFANQVTRDWTAVVQQNGMPAGEAIIDRANQQLSEIAPGSIVAYARRNVPLTAECKGPDPDDIVGFGINITAVLAPQRSLVYGVYGTYLIGRCGPAYSTITIFGQ